MQVPKPSEETKQRFRALISDAPGVEIKAMFGNLGAFINGNMFAGLFGESVGVKLLDQSSRNELSAIAGTGPFGPAERPMGGYIALPAPWGLAPAKATAWIERAMLEVSSLPPKKAKPRKTRG